MIISQNKNKKDITKNRKKKSKLQNRYKIVQIMKTKAKVNSTIQASFSKINEIKKA